MEIIINLEKIIVTELGFEPVSLKRDRFFVQYFNHLAKLPSNEANNFLTILQNLLIFDLNSYVNYEIKLY